MNRSIITTLLLLLAPAVAAAGLSLEVDLASRELRLYQDQEVMEKYPVSIGKSEKPTPRGQFRIRKVVWNPAWVPPNEKWARGKKPAPPGHPDNPMKRVKMFFREPDYYIHGTDELESLGDARSHGCIRMDPDDVTRLARMVMEHGGKPQPEPWYRRVFRSRISRTVILSKPIPIRIG